MESRIQKWGNSQGLRFSLEILRQAHMHIGDAVDIKVKKGQIIIRPSRQKRKYRLKDLLAKIPAGYKPEEVDWGEPTGKEAW